MRRMRILMRQIRAGLAVLCLALAAAAGGPAPSALAQDAKAAAERQNLAAQGWFGAEIANVTAEEAAAAGLPGPGGVRVVGTMPGGPAARAGFRPGDIIAALDGKPVENIDAFIETIQARKPRTRVRLKVVRGGRRRTASAVLGARKGQTEFERLYDQAVAGKTAEERILAADKALAMEPGLKIWPMASPRNRVRGLLLRAKADACLQRGGPGRAEDVEMAVSALEGALPELPRESFPFDWAAIQNDYGLALWQRIRGDKADNIERAIAAYEAALTVRTREARPQEWAAVQNNLGIVYKDRIRGERAENLEKAIAAFEAALSVYTPDAYPANWATAQNNLGNVYADRIRGERAENLEKAIAALEAALTVRTREAYPQDWAMTQNNLAGAYGARLRGGKAGNIEKAIAALEAALTVYTREAFPREWAMAQYNLGTAYFGRLRGERAENLEKAIAALEAALTVRTREAFPQDWALTQNVLANTYQERLRGGTAENLEKAIAAFEAALSVHTREAYPNEWAMAQNNLGIAYSRRIRGDRAENIDKAIACLNAALTVHTRDAFPQEWAESQNNLGNAYWNRIRGERAENIERAIAAHEAALTVHTREAFPQAWATSQNNLGIAYGRRIRGGREENLEKALAHFQAALTVFTRETFPQHWATAQNNLGTAYVSRIKGEREENIARAIAAHEAALTVFSRESFPHEWAGTQSNLGSAYRSGPRTSLGGNIEKAIAAYEAALTVLKPESQPEDWAKVQSNLGRAYDERLEGDRGDNIAKAIAAHEAELTVFTHEAYPRDHLRAALWLGHMFLKTQEWERAARAYASARKAFLLLFGQGLDEAGARDLIALAGPLFSEAAYTAAQLGDAASAFSLASEGRARLLSVSLRLETLDLPPAERERLSGLRQDIRKAEETLDLATGNDRAAAVGRLADLRKALSALVEAALLRAAPPGGALGAARDLTEGGAAIALPVLTSEGGKLLTAAAAQNGLAVTALDLPGLTTDRLVKFLAEDGGGGIPGGWLGAYAIQYLPPEEQGARLTDWLAAIGGLGPELWALIGEPLHSELAKRGVSPGARLIWLPAGSLGLLPIGLAQNPATGERLGGLYEIAYAPSLEALAAARSRFAIPAPAALAAAVDPTGDLTFAGIEGQLVAGRFAAGARTVLARDAATPDAVLAALAGRNYWHFASHGTFNWKDARQSALLMHAGAPLSVGRLLAAEGLGRPRLAVLSACETGLSEIGRTPNEFLGLPGAFLALGAGGVVGTLWQVDDRATALLVARFYDLHLGEGLSPPAALKAAQAWLRDATRADLVAYAKAAAASGRIADADLAAEFVASLARGRPDNARFAAVWDAAQNRQDRERNAEAPARAAAPAAAGPSAENGRPVPAESRASPPAVEPQAGAGEPGAPTTPEPAPGAGPQAGGGKEAEQPEASASASSPAQPGTAGQAGTPAADAPQAGGSSETPESSIQEAASPQRSPASGERPFAHPFYWGGFIYTGL